jgi:uncharacterized membrane protein SirB2
MHNNCCPYFLHDTIPQSFSRTASKLARDGEGSVVIAMAHYYNEIKWVHISCVLLSGSLFASRGLAMLGSSRYANNRVLARLSYVIDTALLVAAVLLALIIHQYPFVQAWLTVKVVLLVIYILLGVFALRRGKTRWRRTGYFVAALAVYAFIISVAVMHNPRGVFAMQVTMSSLIEPIADRPGACI